MSKSIVATENAPKAIGPYSQAVAAGGLVFVSGQLPADPKTGDLAGPSVAAQTEASIANVAAILAASGCTLADVVKTTVFMTDLGRFAEMNAVYAKHFTADMPARACVQVAALPRGAQVEIEAVAVK